MDETYSQPPSPAALPGSLPGPAIELACRQGADAKERPEDSATQGSKVLAAPCGRHPAPKLAAQTPRFSQCLQGERKDTESRDTVLNIGSIFNPLIKNQATCANFYLNIQTIMVHVMVEGSSGGVLERLMNVHTKM